MASKPASPLANRNRGADGARRSVMCSFVNGDGLKGRYPCGQNMAEHQRAWERQSDSRQWDEPEGDDPVTLQDDEASVERFPTSPVRLRAC